MGIEMFKFEERLERAFEEGYLRAFSKSDFQVISEILMRDVKLVRILPREQQLKLAETLQAAVDEIQGSVVDISD
jgi:hypothetical protein